MDLFLHMVKTYYMLQLPNCFKWRLLDSDSRLINYVQLQDHMLYFFSNVFAFCGSALACTSVWLISFNC
jgi:hypothetical protein